MRILLLGAGGFIGAACLIRLIQSGHTVRALVRRRGSKIDGVEWKEADLRSLLTAEQWRPLVEGCDAVINSAGVFSDRAGDSTRIVHTEAPHALYQACELAGVKRVVLLSAVGVDDGRTAFSRTKKAGEVVLQQSALDWIILRPSIVLGESAYGGGALLRGMAALPICPIEKRQGKIQPVQLGDVVDTILWALAPRASPRLILELAGPEQLAICEAASAYRAWFGWKPAKRISVSAWMMTLAYVAGELFNRLGWRSPVSLTGRREMERGGAGDSSLWKRATGIEPKPLVEALAVRPPNPQERMFASLYFLQPMAFIITSLFWLGTGITSIGPGYGIGIDLMREGGAGALAGPSVIAGGLADIAIGLGIAFRRTARLALWAAIAISVFYFVAGTILLPELWLDPIGPMLKIWPLIAFNIVCLALLHDR